MQAVILVGGLGTRMRPLTHHVPKPMMPVANVPFIECMVRWLARHDVDEVILSMGYLPDAIEQHFHTHPIHGVTVRYIVEDHPLGTGGGIKHAARLLTGTFLALNGDVLTDLDVTAAVRTHRQRAAKVTIALVSVDDPTQYGVVETDSDGRIVGFTEKPQPAELRSNRINAGLYVIEPEVLTEVPEGVEHSIERQLFPSLLAQGQPLYGYDIGASYWIDIGTPAKYLAANADALAGRVKVDIPGALREGVWFGEASAWLDGARAEAPCAFGRNCLLGAGARLGPRVVLGNNVVVEDEATLRDCVIWSDTTIGRGARVRGAVIGRSCTIKPNANVEAGAVFEDGTTIE